jgi:hypothetical protein
MAEFSGYDGHRLVDVERLSEERTGVALLSPAGFEVRLVFDMAAGKVVYENSSIPAKSRREEMRLESLSVADAVRLARAAVSMKMNDTR